MLSIIKTTFTLAAALSRSPVTAFNLKEGVEISNKLEEIPDLNQNIVQTTREDDPDDTICPEKERKCVEIFDLYPICK